MSTTNGADDPKAIAGRIIKARNALGIAQKEFAELAHVTVRTIYEWETTGPPYTRVGEIAAILEADRNWLLYGDEGDVGEDSSEMRSLLERVLVSQQDIIDQIKLLRLELKGDGQIPF